MVGVEENAVGVGQDRVEAARPHLGGDGRLAGA
jgi:hypothetical protein